MQYYVSVPQNSIQMVGCATNNTDIAEARLVIDIPNVRSDLQFIEGLQKSTLENHGLFQESHGSTQTMKALFINNTEDNNLTVIHCDFFGTTTDFDQNFMATLFIYGIHVLSACNVHT